MVEISFHRRLRAQLSAAQKWKCQHLAKRSVFFEKAAQKRSVKINAPVDGARPAASRFAGI
jgi:hypothetical protein